MINASALFLTAILSFAALILAIVACAGSTSNYNPINKIFVAQLNLRNLDVKKIFSKASGSIPSSELGSLDLPAYVNIGLWSYCVANEEGSVTHCTSPNGIQKFDVKKMLTDGIQDNKVSKMIDTFASAMMPSSLQKKMGYYNDLVECMFVTILIGICALFVDLVINIIRWIFHLRLLNWFGRFFASIGFICLIISAGASTGTYVYIRHLLKENYDDYGMKLSLGSVFLGLLWAAVGGALLNTILWGIVRTRKKIYSGSLAPSDEKPLI